MTQKDRYINKLLIRLKKMKKGDICWDSGSDCNSCCAWQEDSKCGDDIRNIINNLKEELDKD